MASQELEISYYVQVEGSQEFIEELRDKIDDLVFEAFNIHCDDPECCPGPMPTDNYVAGAVGSSTIHPPQKEEDE